MIREPPAPSLKKQNPPVFPAVKKNKNTEDTGKTQRAAGFFPLFL
jgi:hypothetical protein